MSASKGSKSSSQVVTLQSNSFSDSLQEEDNEERQTETQEFLANADPEDEVIELPQVKNLKSISKNLTIGFFVILLILLFKVIVTIGYLIKFWGTDSTQFFWITVANTSLQLVLCLLFTLYFKKIKTFYTQPRTRVDAPAQVKDEEDIAVEQPKPYIDQRKT